jgi:formamidopyrimidine-DNA glycosylase
MPELPEVETVVRMIRPRLVGRRITACEVSWKRTIADTSLAEFRRELVGRRVLSVGRRAKFITIELEPARWLVCHLRMTGRLHVEPRGWDAGPFAKVRLDLDDLSALHFIDVRKFGRMWLLRDTDELFGALGPEPLSPEFTPELLFESLRSRRRLLKPLLLDQSFVAGLGNIYADEALFRARLHPLQLSHRVTREQAGRLHAEIRATLTEAIEVHGSSFDVFYRTPEGEPGGYQDEFKVYGRDGEPCVACGTPIRRLVVAQRGTHVCPSCQPRPRRERAVIRPSTRSSAPRPRRR